MPVAADASGARRVPCAQITDYPQSVTCWRDVFGQTIMIERLTRNLDILARSSVAELASDQGRRVVADCADAIRLELDCPQQELDASQRELLTALGDRLEDGGEPAGIRALARRGRTMSDGCPRATPLLPVSSRLRSRRSAAPVVHRHAARALGSLPRRS